MPSRFPGHPVLTSLEYRKLDRFVYHVLTSSAEITNMLRYWVGQEWEIDAKETPNGTWIADWIAILASQKFELRELPVDAIHLYQPLMTYEFGDYSFARSLDRRATEREQSILRGMSLEPLMVRGDTFELMDGYTRYQVLIRHGQTRTFAYVSSSR